MSKPFWQSKTLWVNVLGIIAAILLLATKSFELSAEVVEVIMFIWGSISIVLRFLTSTQLTK